MAQRWATGGSAVGPPLAATGGPTSFWPVGQRWPNSGMPLLGHRWPNVVPPVAPPLGHRWQPPVGQHHFGQWANVGPTVACGIPVGSPVGHRWANISATGGPMINSDKCSTVFKTLFTNSSQTQTKSSPNLLKPTGTRLRRLYNSGADLLVTAALITTTVA